jgi:hypothetical protein
MKIITILSKQIIKVRKSAIESIYVLSRSKVDIINKEEYDFR